MVFGKGDSPAGTMNWLRKHLVWLALFSSVASASVPSGRSLVLLLDHGGNAPTEAAKANANSGFMEDVGELLVRRHLSPVYSRIHVLRDGLASASGLFSTLRSEAKRADRVDLIILSHGSEGQLSLRAGNLTRAKLQAEFLRSGRVPRLGLVYLLACHGASVAEEWQRLGAQEIIAHQRENVLPAVFLPRFLRLWGLGEWPARRIAKDVFRWAAEHMASLGPLLQNPEMVSERALAGSGLLFLGGDLDVQGRRYPVVAREAMESPSTDQVAFSAEANRRAEALGFSGSSSGSLGLLSATARSPETWVWDRIQELSQGLSPEPKWRRTGMPGMNRVWTVYQDWLFDLAREFGADLSSDPYSDEVWLDRDMVLGYARVVGLRDPNGRWEVSLDGLWDQVLGIRLRRSRGVDGETAADLRAELFLESRAEIGVRLAAGNPEDGDRVLTVALPTVLRGSVAWEDGVIRFRNESLGLVPEPQLKKWGLTFGVDQAVFNWVNGNLTVRLVEGRLPLMAEVGAQWGPKVNWSLRWGWLRKRNRSNVVPPEWLAAP